VHFSHVDPDEKTRPSAEQIVSILDRAGYRATGP
jgi:hypothetical protein